MELNRHQPEVTSIISSGCEGFVEDECRIFFDLNEWKGNEPEDSIVVKLQEYVTSGAGEKEGKCTTRDFGTKADLDAHVLRCHINIPANVSCGSIGDWL